MSSMLLKLLTIVIVLFFPFLYNCMFFECFALSMYMVIAHTSVH